MTRLCLLGDSHLAAVKLGWDALSGSHPHVLADFFGTPGKGMAEIILEDGRLVSHSAKVRRSFVITSGGQDSVRLDDYDVFALVGMGFSMVSLVRTIYSRFRANEHDNLDGDITLVDDATFLDLCRRKLAGSAGYRLGQLIRGATAASIVIVPQPLPSELLLSTSDGQLDAPIWQEAVRAGDDVRLGATLEAVLREVTSDRLTVLRPPDRTRAGQIFTSQQYCAGSVRLSAGLGMQHPASDLAHMNAAYGREIIDALIRGLPTRA